MYKFEKLLVWKESILLTKYCYKLTNHFPAYESSGLSDQLRRAATSISLNIAEGSGSDTDKDFCRFLYLARKSLFEVVAILKVGEEIHNISVNDTLFKKCESTCKLLNGLINKLKAKNK